LRTLALRAEPVPLLALAAWYFGSYADEVSFWHSHDFEEDADEKGWEAVQISANKRTREQHKAGASDGTG
jgi:hypothetical protein